MWMSMLIDGKFCGLDVGYTEQADGGYLVNLDQGQYNQFKDCKASSGTASSTATAGPGGYSLALTAKQYGELKSSGLNVGYTEQDDGSYLVALDQDQYTQFMDYRASSGTASSTLTAAAPASGGQSLALTAKQYGELKSSGLNVGYTEQDDGSYLVALDQDQYTQFMDYRASSGTAPSTLTAQDGYELVLPAEQFEELKKHNVFAGMDINYTMRDGNYIVKLTDAEYGIYLKNKKVAGPLTSMQYNITMAAGRIQLHNSLKVHLVTLKLK